MKNRNHVFAVIIFLSISLLYLYASSLCFAIEGSETKEVKKSDDAEKNLKPKQGDKFKNSVGMEFVYIEPGKFMMGSPTTEANRDADEKQHDVTLTKGFWMQTTEVTQGQWKTVMKTEPWNSISNPEHGKDYVRMDDKCPADNVTWKDAKAFCEKLSKAGETYRLPTEAEWEYACRAGTATAYFWGDNIDGKYCWYDGNAFDAKEKYAHEVATKEPNKWGLYDMSGNVWEWCEDKYGDYPSGSVANPSGPVNGEYWVLRGGSWIGNSANCRSAQRLGRHPNSYGSLGFRLVRTSK